MHAVCVLLLIVSIGTIAAEEAVNLCRTPSVSTEHALTMCTHDGSYTWDQRGKSIFGLLPEGQLPAPYYMFCGSYVKEASAKTAVYAGHMTPDDCETMKTDWFTKDKGGYHWDRVRCHDWNSKLTYCEVLIDQADGIAIWVKMDYCKPQEGVNGSIPYTQIGDGVKNGAHEWAEHGLTYITYVAKLGTLGYGENFTGDAPSVPFEHMNTSCIYYPQTHTQTAQVECSGPEPPKQCTPIFRVTPGPINSVGRVWVERWEHGSSWAFVAIIFGCFWCQTSFGYIWKTYTVDIDGICFRIKRGIGLVHVRERVMQTRSHLTATNLANTANNSTNPTIQSSMMVSVWHGYETQINYVSWVMMVVVFCVNWFTPGGPYYNSIVICSIVLVPYVGFRLFAIWFNSVVRNGTGVPVAQDMTFGVYCYGDEEASCMPTGFRWLANVGKEAGSASNVKNTTLILMTVFGVDGVFLPWKLFVVMTQYLFPHAHKHRIPGLMCFVGSQPVNCNEDKRCTRELLCRIDTLMGAFYESIDGESSHTLRIMCIVIFVALVCMRKEMFSSSTPALQSHVCSFLTNMAVLSTFAMIPASYWFAVYEINNSPRYGANGLLSMWSFSLGHCMNVMTANAWPGTYTYQLHDRPIQDHPKNIAFLLLISAVCFMCSEKREATINSFIFVGKDIVTGICHGVFVNYKQPLWWYVVVFNGIAYYSFYTEDKATPKLLVYQTQGMFAISTLYICSMCLGIDKCRSFFTKEEGLYGFLDVRTYHTCATNLVHEIVNRVYFMPKVVAPRSLWLFVGGCLLDQIFSRILEEEPWADCEVCMFCICLFVMTRVEVSTISATVPTRSTYTGKRIISICNLLPQATNDLSPIFETKDHESAILMSSTKVLEEGVTLKVPLLSGVVDQKWTRRTHFLFS